MANITEAELAQKLASGDHMYIKFFAPWCPHCTTLAPEWDRLGPRIGSADVVSIDVTQVRTDQLSFANGQSVDAVKGRGVPSIVMTDGSRVQRYTGERDVASMRPAAERWFAGGLVGGGGGGPPLPRSGVVIKLNAKGLKSFLRSGRSGVVNFHDPDCVPCRQLAPEYARLATLTSDPVISVNIAKHTDAMDVLFSDDRSVGDVVEGTPTILLFEAGGVPRRYDGARNVAEDMLNELRGGGGAAREDLGGLIDEFERAEVQHAKTIADIQSRAEHILGGAEACRAIFKV